MPSNPEGLDFFARLRSQPEHQDEFFACMANITKWKPDWTEYFDTSHLVDDEVVRKGESGLPIFVDVGGSSGTDVTRFLKRHPDVPAGSLVLQDTPDVIAMVSLYFGSFCGIVSRGLGDSFCCQRGKLLTGDVTCSSTQVAKTSVTRPSKSSTPRS